MSILFLGLLIYGGIGLYTLTNKDLAPLRRVSLIGSVAMTLGILKVLWLLDLIQYSYTIYLIIMIVGVGLLFWALILRNSAKA